MKLLAVCSAILAVYVSSVLLFSGESLAKETVPETSALSNIPSLPSSFLEEGYFIHIRKKEYLPSEIITVNVSSVPDRMLKSNAVVIIREVGTPDGTFVSREFIHKRDCLVRMRAPVKPGDYEMIGYDNGIMLGETAVAARVVFSVASFSLGGYDVILDKSSYHPSERMTVFVSGVQRDMIENSAVVGIFKHDAASGEYMFYEYVRRNNEKITMRAPFEPGEYEVRGFSNGFNLSSFTMTAKVPFKVEGSALGAYHAVPVRRRYAPGEKMTINVNGVPKYMLDDGAILGITSRNAKPGEFVAYKYIAASGGSYAFDAPSSPGEYEVRAYTNKYFLDDSTLASRNTFMVAE
jgi:hypothetical protein